MNLRLLLVLLMLWHCVSAQDADIGRLILELSSDQVDIRQEAERKLVEYGERARPTLGRVARDGELEARTRARRILATLDRAATRANALGPAWRISIPERTYSLQEISNMFARQCEIPLSYPEKFAGSRFSMQAQDIGVWAFLNRLCEAHGELMLPLDQPDGSFSLVEGRPSRAPTSYSGPWRTWIDKISCYVGESSGHTTRSVRIVLGIAWQHNVHPMAIQGLGKEFDFKVSEIVDAKGAQITCTASDEIDAGAFSLDSDRKNAWRSIQRFSLPANGGAKLERLAGSIKLVFPSLVEVLEFEDPLENVGKTIRVGSFGVSLMSCEPDETGIAVHIRFSCDESGGRNRRVTLPVRFRKETVRSWGKDGGAAMFQPRNSTHTSEIEKERFDMKGTFPIKERLKKISIPFVVDYFEKEVPFEFSDIVLP